MRSHLLSVIHPTRSLSAWDYPSKRNAVVFHEDPHRILIENTHTWPHPLQDLSSAHFPAFQFPCLNLLMLWSKGGFAACILHFLAQGLLTPPAHRLMLCSSVCFPLILLVISAPPPANIAVIPSPSPFSPAYHSSGPE